MSAPDQVVSTDGLLPLKSLLMSLPPPTTRPDGASASRSADGEAA